MECFSRIEKTRRSMENAKSGGRSNQLMKVYQWIPKSIPIFVLSIIILNVNFCSKKIFEEKPDDSNAKSFWLYYLTVNSYYNNCPPVNAVLDSGTHTIDLADGQEYWFDITAKGNLSKAITSSYIYKIEIQYEPSNTFYLFDGNCLRQSIYPTPQYTPDYLLSDVATSVGGFYPLKALFPSNNNSRYYLMGIKLKNSNGTVTIKVP